MRRLLLAVLTLAIAPLVFSCANKIGATPAHGGGSAGGGLDAANSTSAIAAAIVSGAAAQSSGQDIGTVTGCPTYLSPGTSTCAGTGLQLLNLTYAACTLGSSLATWTGGQSLLFSGSAVCGTTTLPLVAPTDTLTRTFIGSIPGGNATVRTEPGGFTVSLDTQTPFGYAFTVAGGFEINGNGTGQHKINITGIRLLSTLWDHSISTAASQPLLIVTGTGRAILAGTVLVQHNLAHYTGTAVFSNVGYISGSCFPQSGTITTTFSGSLQGTETLTFTGGGGATLIDVAGTTTNFVQTHCF